MTNEILHRFSNLKIYTRRGSKAPNKPLLALWAIGRCLRGLPRLAEYGLVDRELSKLLMRFGPPRQTIHTEQPFWRMQGDEVWEIDRPELVKCTKKGDAHKKDLIEHAIPWRVQYGSLRNASKRPQLGVSRG